MYRNQALVTHQLCIGHIYTHEHFMNMSLTPPQTMKLILAVCPKYSDVLQQHYQRPAVPSIPAESQTYSEGYNINFLKMLNWIMSYKYFTPAL